MDIVLVLLRKYWKQLAVIAVILSMAGVIAWKDHTIKSQASNITTLQSQLAEAKDDLVKCQGRIEHQNEEILKASDESKKKFQAIDALGTILEGMKKDQKATLQALRDQPAPKTCEDTRAYLANGLEDLQWP
jgi:chromosome segregation ATPase